ncbi:hypothetical protein [Staphylococcus gallinarum]|uniref:hypothetical protein n=1 Tax=Staphylococcus gallinarum TaxID=1293 RepID=UPI003F5603C9
MKKIIIVSMVFMLALVGCSSKNESDTNENNNVINSEKMVKTFLEHSYSDNDIKQWDKFEDYASSQLKNKVKNQNQSFDDNGITKEVENITVYKNTNNSNKFMYDIKVKTTDDNAKNIDYNERYGTATLKKENGKLKINTLKEVGSETYNGGE